MAIDRVQVLKQESAALGGDSADTAPWPAPIDPQEDAIESAGLYLQDASNRDTNVFITRAGNDMSFTDVSNPTYLLSNIAVLIGRTGGQTFIGSQDATGDLTLQSTSNASKGHILFGNSGYDEANNRLGLGTTIPDTLAHLYGTEPDITYEDSAAGDKFKVGNDGGTFRVYNVTDTRTDIAADGAGRVSMGGAAANIGGVGSVLQSRRRTSYWGMSIYGEGANQSDLMFYTESGAADEKIVQAVLSATTFQIRGLTDALNVSYLFLGGNLSTGSVFVGSGFTPSARLHVRAASLGSTADDEVEVFSLRSDTANVDQLRARTIRQSSGSNWDTAFWKLQRRVDSTEIGYIGFGSNSTDLLTFGKGATEYMRIDGSGQVGVGTDDPSANLHVSASTPILFLDSTSAGASALSRTMAGIQLGNIGSNPSNKYTPAIKFVSSDPNFTTENPKFLAAIVGRDTEGYYADTDGGMALDFAVTPDNPGATSVPTVAMTLDQTGYLSIGTTSTPEVLLHLQGGDATRLRVDDTSSGNSALTQDMSGIELVASGMNATPNQYGAAVKFMSSDGNLDDPSGTLPKFCAGVVGRATETYSANTDGGMAVDILASPWNPGADSVPTVVASFYAQGDASTNQNLELSGAIVVDQSINTPPAGTIEWDGSNFRGWDGTGWQNFDNLGGLSGSGSPLVDQVTLWASSNAITGTANLKFDGTELRIAHATNPAQIRMVPTSGNSDPSSRIYLLENDEAYGGFILYDGSTNYLRLGTRSASVDTDVINIARTAFKVGINTTAPVASLQLTDNNESTTRTDITQALTSAGILITTEYTSGAYTPGLFWSTSNNNADKPKAGIYVYESGSGTRLILGTSNAYATGITNDFAINASGYVGIGTIAPQSLLELKGPSATLTINAETGSGEILFQEAGSDRWSIRQSVVNKLHLEWAGTTKVTFDGTGSSGYVGINEESPTHRLHIVGAALGGSIFVQDSETSTAAPYVRVRGDRTDANQSPVFAGRLVLEHFRTDAAMDDNYKGYLGAIVFGANHTSGSSSNIAFPASIGAVAEGTFSNLTTMPTALVFHTGSTGIAALDTDDVDYGTERLRIDSGGFVGIGEPDPSQLLHITGSSDDTRIRLETSGGSYVDIGPQNGSYVHFTKSGYAAGFYFNDRIVIGDGELLAYSTNDLKLMTGEGTTRLFIETGTGDVGIGTTNPGAKLDVAGSARLGTSPYVTIGAFASTIDFSYAGANAIRCTSSGGTLSFRVDGSSTDRMLIGTAWTQIEYPLQMTDTLNTKPIGFLAAVQDAYASVTGSVNTTALTIPANKLRAGSVIRVRCGGQITNVGTCTAVYAKARIGGTETASFYNPSPTTNESFYGEIVYYVRSVGSSGSFDWFMMGDWVGLGRPTYLRNSVTVNTTTSTTVQMGITSGGGSLSNFEWDYITVEIFY